MVWFRFIYYYLFQFWILTLISGYHAPEIIVLKFGVANLKIKMVFRVLCKQICPI